MFNHYKLFILKQVLFLIRDDDVFLSQEQILIKLFELFHAITALVSAFQVMVICIFVNQLMGYWFLMVIKPPN